jgi:hypothetical protein
VSNNWSQKYFIYFITIDTHNYSYYLAVCNIFEVTFYIKSSFPFLPCQNGLLLMTTIIYWILNKLEIHKKIKEKPVIKITISLVPVNVFVSTVQPIAVKIFPLLIRNTGTFALANTSYLCQIKKYQFSKKSKVPLFIYNRDRWNLVSDCKCFPLEHRFLTGGP